ncbi:MAG: efflux RND transporter periplasmic adaptor subunit [Pseudomonadota bacterium]
MSRPAAYQFTPYTLRIVLIVGALVALAACQPHAAPPMGFPTAEVTTVTVQPKTVPVTFEYMGQTAGSREVEVRARVNGILLKRNYQEGSSVKAGQSLFTIDPAQFQAVVARGEADLAGAQARLSQAQHNAARLKPLFEAKAVSQKEYDDAVSSEQIAAADVKSAKARVTEARLNLGYTKVESPISGLASRALRSEGNLVSGPDVLLTTVTQIDPIYVNFGISATDQLKLKHALDSGQLQFPQNGKFEVTVKLSDGGVYAHAGKLNFTDPRVSTATGTSDARAELPNAQSTLKPGQFVRVQLAGAVRPNAILVPQRAVLEGPTGKFVYVVKEGKADSRPVQVGDWSGDSWVVESGLKAGDNVIVDGVMKIGPGAPVKVAQAGAAPGKENAAAKSPDIKK